MVRVRITRKLAEEIDGVDLSHNRVDQVVDLPDRKARMLIAEGWAIPERRWKGPPFRERAKYARRAGD